VREASASPIRGDFMRSICAALLVLAAAAAGGQETETIRLQSRARELIDAAVAAIGGEAPLRSLSSVRRDYVEDWVDVGQGPRPWAGTPAADALRPHAYSARSQTLSYIDYAGGRFHLWARFVESPSDFGEFSDAVTAERAFQAFTYVREKPILTERSREEGQALRQRHVRQHPEGLLRIALERPDTLLSLGHAQDGDAVYDLVAFADHDGTQVVLYLDARSHLPARSEIRRGHRVYGDTTADVVYDDYRRVGELLLPHAWVTRVAGVPVSRYRARAIAIDAAPDDARFRAPAENVAGETAPAKLRVEPQGHGLYVIRGSYNLTFAEFRDHVLLVEAPAGEAFMEEALALIEETVPGKPVRLVATHFHFDHVGGVRTAVARGIPVLTTPDASPVIERSLASRQAMRPDALARAPREATIVVVERRHVIEDGRQRVELYDFGPVPHVAQLLVAYYPRQRLLHVGDLFDTLTTEAVFAGTDAEAMAARIRELGLDVERIVPTHGVPVTIRHLERALEIRRQYREGTR
jgi:glyoxylase-like metal-dependent hydrolase (beta-lactamase superfamily II)